MEQAERWRIAPGYELLWFEGDDGQVVYHGGSGDTHLIDEAAAALLHLLQSRPQTPIALSSSLVADGRVAADEAPEYTAMLLQELARLGLVEPCP
ncbi:MAG: HPr-rel-A system PqqD family peptide chaperone [Gammaproteobacteria bacterium]|jgi:PqqD family protein of HPr-rel-A system|nr:HPr-rel-A system PqqD family peptide chaperone [Gammaproteobacteria bacterium]